MTGAIATGANRRIPVSFRFGRPSLKLTTPAAAALAAKHNVSNGAAGAVFGLEGRVFRIGVRFKG